MATTGVGFRWLDILEKEFDKACVELDTSLGLNKDVIFLKSIDFDDVTRVEIASRFNCLLAILPNTLQHFAELESEEPEVVYAARQRIATLGSCFAQLTHKALTVFQHSAKLEAEIVDMRADLIQVRAASAGGGRDGGDAAGNVPEAARARAEAAQLARENAALRETVLALHSELFGARLATKYLDKELAGRIQQLQLLGRDMRSEVRDSLWAQVEAEILLQRHKTLVRVCRGLSPAASSAPPAAAAPCDARTPRIVHVTRDQRQGLGISVTGGREHGVPILISELEAGGPAARTGHLYVGDAILAVNDIDLTQACHKEAVQALQSTRGDCQLCVQFIATDDEDRLSEDNYRFPLYPSDDACYERGGGGVTPTAPRTPEYHRPESEASYSDEEGDLHTLNVPAPAETAALNTNGVAGTGRGHAVAGTGAVTGRGHAAILDMDDHSIKIQADLEVVGVESSEPSPVVARRHRGPYRAIPLSSDSPASTPVHRRPNNKKKRNPDWRNKGAYKAVDDDRSDGGDSPECIQDCPPTSTSPSPPELTPLQPLPPPREPPRVPQNVPSVPQSVLSVPQNIPSVPQSVPNVPRGGYTHVPNLPNGDVKANGDGKRRDKAFRIGSARRVTPTGERLPLTNGVCDRSDRAGIKPATAALLAGDGDPDFGTPV